MQIIIGAAEFSSVNVPIAVKFTVNDLKCIVDNIKKGELVFVTVPTGTKPSRLFEKFATLVKHKKAIKAILGAGKDENEKPEIIEVVIDDLKESPPPPPPKRIIDEDVKIFKRGKKNASTKTKTE